MIFQTILANFSPVVRHDQMEGRNYLVAPMVMLVEGVHDGTAGPGYYPAEEIAKVPGVWNHKPVVVYHPQQNGQMLSACDPIIFSSRKIGVIMNAKFEDGKLKAEAWLEAHRIAAVDERVGLAIENNQTMELSTGLYTDRDNTEGSWNGEDYKWVARNFMPDHLALLPDIKGACSVEDGAGFLRLNSQTRKFEKFNFTRSDVLAMVANEMSHDSVRSLLRSALDETKEDAWIEDVYDEFFVYEQNGALFAQAYTIKEGAVSIVGLPEQVVRVTEYRTTAGVFVGNQDSLKGIIMTDKEKKQIVDELISNEKTLWVEDDREELMGMSAKALKVSVEQSKLATNAEPNSEDGGDGKKEKEDDGKEKKDDVSQQPGQVQNEDGSDKTTKPNEPLTAEQYIANAPGPVREALSSAMSTLQREKGKLIKTILGNEQNTFTEEQLKDRPVDELIALAKLAAPIENKDDESARPNYVGQGPVRSNEVKEEPLKTPTMNFDPAKEAVA